MIIRTSTREIEVNAIIGETMKSGAHQFPALRIILPAGISDQDLASLLEGSFTIVSTDEDGNEVEYSHEGYNTLKEVAITIAQVSAPEQQISDLESQLASIQAEINAANAELASTKAEVDAAKNELVTAKSEANAAKSELEAAKSELDIVKAENATYQEEIAVLETENAELLFNNLTNSNLPSAQTE